MAKTLFIGAKDRQVIGGDGRTRNSVKRDSILLTKDKVKELFTDREKNREKIIKAMNLYAYRIARQLSHDNSFIDDYYQTALVAINNAIDKFDPGVNVAFHTFCNFYIMNEIFYLKRDLGIGHGNHNYNKVSKFLYENADKNTTPEEAKVLYDKMYSEFQYKPSIKVFQYCMSPTKIYTSLNNPVGDGDDERIDFVECKDEKFNKIDVLTFWSELEKILKKECGKKWQKYYYGFIKTLRHDDYICIDADVTIERLRQLFHKTTDIIKKYPYLKTISVTGQPILVKYKNDDSVLLGQNDKSTNTSATNNVADEWNYIKTTTTPLLPNEILKKIKGFKGYFVSNYGRIFKAKKNTYHLMYVNYCKKTNRHRVQIRKNNKTYTLQLHRTVALHFIDNPRNYPDVLFVNGNNEDCRVENLFWGNQPGHIAPWNPKTKQKGETCIFNEKLTEQKVIEIYIDPRSHSAIAKDNNISRPFVTLIKSGKRWGWLTKDLTLKKQAI